MDDASIQATASATRTVNTWDERLTASGVYEALKLPLIYAGFICLSAMDGLCTGIILQLGGTEVNPIADAVLSRFGFPGMIAFKFLLVTLIIVCCEQIMRVRPRVARTVMGICIVVTLVPVMVATTEFVAYFALMG